MKRSPPDHRAAAARAAINALRRARRAAERTGVPLSQWEGDFLGSLEDRVRRFGRAFGDREKGAPGQALSVRQGVKLREITAKTTKASRASPSDRTDGEGT